MAPIMSLCHEISIFLITVDRAGPLVSKLCTSFFKVWLAATSSLSDRTRIFRERDSAGKDPVLVKRQVNLSPQVLLNCDLESQGCHGGDGLSAYRYIHEKGTKSKIYSYICESKPIALPLKMILVMNLSDDHFHPRCTLVHLVVVTKVPGYRVLDC